jgi:hypothetical protein
MSLHLSFGAVPRNNWMNGQVGDTPWNLEMEKAQCINLKKAKYQFKE